MELTFIVISASKNLTSTVGITYEYLVSRLNDNILSLRGLYCVQSLSKMECGSDLEQSSIDSEDNSLYVGARNLC